MNGPFQRIFSSVFNRRSASCWLFLRAHLAVDLEEAREQVGSGGELAVGIDRTSTSFSISVSSIGKSRVRNFFGKSLNQNVPVASVPARLRA